MNRSWARIWGAGATLWVAAAFLTGCIEKGEDGSGDGGGVPTIVLVTYDGLPRGYLAPFGGSVAAPNVARLAGLGGFSGEAVTAAPMTRPAIASILSGRGVDRHGVLDDLGAPLGAAVPVVTESLREAGYRTAAFPVNPVLRESSGLLRGFDVIDPPPDPALNPSERIVYPVEAGKTIDPVIAWLETVGAEERIFVWLHFPGAACAGQAILEEQGLATRQGYFTAVDRALGVLLDDLAGAGRLDAAEIHLIGTYGEVWEGGVPVIGPGFSSSDEAIRVPYLFKPGGGRGRPETGAQVWGPDVAASLAVAGGVALEGAEGEDVATLGSEARTLFSWSAAPRDQMGWAPWVAAIEGDHRVVVGWGAGQDARDDPDLDRLREAAERRATMPEKKVPFETAKALLESVGVEVDPVAVEQRACPPTDPCAEAVLDVWTARYKWFGNDRRGAAKAYRAALEKDPYNLAALVEWGLTAIPTTTRGKEKTRRAATLYPQNPLALHWMGHTFVDETSAAEEIFRTVVPYVPWHADLLYDLACMRSLAGDLDGSEEYLRRSIAAGFRYWQLMQTDADLRNLREDPRFAALMREFGN